MSNLVNPHGKEKKLKPLLLEGEALKEEQKKASGLKQILMTSRETSDCIMMGIGAFTPLTGFMGKADWQGVCDDMKMSDGTFWPIPITLSASKQDSDSISGGEEVALVDDETKTIIATMKVEEKYTIDKVHECKQVFTTDDTEHPGVAKVSILEAIFTASP